MTSERTSSTTRMKEAERETRLATISPCSGLTDSPWRFPWNILSVSSPLALAVLFEASMILTWHRAWSSLNRNPLNHHNSEKLSEMSNFKIILINFNIIFPMCRMMAPMGNGDLGHHPEKMLPPPEAPDIQVDIEEEKKQDNILRYSFRLSSQATRSVWMTTQTQTLMMTWGTTPTRWDWAEWLVNYFSTPFFRAMATLGARCPRWIPAQMMPTLSLNTSTTLDRGMQWWYSWLFIQRICLHLKH